MTSSSTTDLQAFYDFLREKLTEGNAPSTPEQALAQWRERSETIAAVEEGMRAVDQGRTKPLDEFAADFRHRHGLPETG
jgi:predicted transcriptional regulator